MDWFSSFSFDVLTRVWLLLLFEVVTVVLLLRHNCSSLGVWCGWLWDWYGWWFVLVFGLIWFDLEFVVNWFVSCLIV